MSLFSDAAKLIGNIPEIVDITQAEIHLIQDPTGWDTPELARAKIEAQLAIGDRIAALTTTKADDNDVAILRGFFDTPEGAEVIASVVKFYKSRQAPPAAA